MASLVPPSFEVTDVRNVGSASLMTTRPRGRGAKGFRNAMAFGSGILTSWGSVTRSEEVVEHYDAQGYLKINLRISGNSAVMGADNIRHRVTDRMCSALLQPKGQVKTEFVSADETDVSVTVACSRDYLISEVGLCPEEFDGPLARYLAGEPTDFTVLRAGFTLEMQHLVESFFQNTNSAFALRLHLQSKTNDLMRMFFESVAKGNRRNQARPSEIELVNRVKRLLNEDLSQTLSADVLAAHVASSVSKMTRLFKAVEGKTVSEYLAEARMQRALALLRQGRLSVTEIAFEVGYEHPANFSTAFGRYFGQSPRQAMAGF